MLIIEMVIRFKLPITRYLASKNRRYGLSDKEILDAFIKENIEISPEDEIVSIKMEEK